MFGRKHNTDPTAHKHNWLQRTGAILGIGVAAANLTGCGENVNAAAPAPSAGLDKPSTASAPVVPGSSETSMTTTPEVPVDADAQEPAPSSGEQPNAPNITAETDMKLVEQMNSKGFESLPDAAQADLVLKYAKNTIASNPAMKELVDGAIGQSVDTFSLTMPDMKDVDAEATRAAQIATAIRALRYGTSEQGIADNLGLWSGSAALDGTPSLGASSATEFLTCQSAKFVRKTKDQAGNEVNQIQLVGCSQNDVALNEAVGANYRLVRTSDGKYLPKFHVDTTTDRIAVN